MIPSLLSGTERPKVYYSKGDLKFNYLKYDCKNNPTVQSVSIQKNKRAKDQEKESENPGQK